MNKTLAIDVGGTKTKAGIFDSSFAYKIIGKDNKSECDNIEKSIIQAVLDIRNEAKQVTNDTVCIVLPEYVKNHEVLSQEVVRFSQNREYLEHELQKITNNNSLQIVFDSDVRAGALAEWNYLQTVKQTEHETVYISLGTGISSTIVLKSGETVTGKNAKAIAIGNWPEKNYLLNQETILEKIISGKAIQDQYSVLKTIRSNYPQKPIKNVNGLSNNSTVLKDKISEDLTHNNSASALSNSNKQNNNNNHFSTKYIIEAAQSKDETAQKIVLQAVDLLAKTIIRIQHFIDPEFIILGGGLGSSNNYLSNAVNEKVTAYSKDIRLVSAHYGSHSTLVGAALIAFQAKH